MTALATYKVSGMHCASCAANIERRLSKLDGVDEAEVSYANETLRVRTSLPLPALIREIEPLGFGLAEDRPAEPDAAEPAELIAMRRQLYAAVPIAVLSILLMGWDIVSPHTSHDCARRRDSRPLERRRFAAAGGVKPGQW